MDTISTGVDMTEQQIWNSKTRENWQPQNSR